MVMARLIAWVERGDVAQRNRYTLLAIFKQAKHAGTHIDHQDDTDRLGRASACGRMQGR